MAPERTAESIAASTRTRGIRAWARSRMVRVADVQRNPATVTQSVGPKVAVCTTNGVMTPRPSGAR